MTKIDSIREFIVKYGSITKLQAGAIFNEYGLKSKINRLIDRGMVIEAKMIQREGRQSYARYVLKGEQL